MFFRILFGVLFAFCMLGAAFSSFGVGGSFQSDNAFGATANAVQGIRPAMFWCMATLVLTISFATREIVGAIHKRQAAEPPPPKVIERQAPLRHLDLPEDGQVLGQRKGETLESWARRVEQAEVAAFKARSKG